MNGEKKYKKYNDDVPYEAVRWVKIIFTIVLCACIGIPTVSRIADAKDDDFDITKGFDETQQEKVWATYSVTDWNKVGGLLFTDDSLILLDKEVQESDFAKSNEKYVSKALKEYKKKTYYKKSSYEKLFFAMTYAISKKGAAMLPEDTKEDISKSALEEAEKSASGVSTSDQGDAAEKADEAAHKLDDMMNGTNNKKDTDSVDWLHVHDICGATPKTPLESAKILIQRYFDAENTYLTAGFIDEHGNEKSREDMDYVIDDTSNTAGLKCVLQATIYGTGYITNGKPHYTYSKDKSKKYREDHPENVHVTFDDFADQALKHYKATPIKNAEDTKVTG